MAATGVCERVEGWGDKEKQGRAEQPVHRGGAGGKCFQSMEFFATRRQAVLLSVARGDAAGAGEGLAPPDFTTGRFSVLSPAMNGSSTLSIVLTCVAFAVGGCASSQMSRIDRNRDIYETWPLEVRQAVLDGKVEPGMNPDMVRVSWGEPSEISVSPGGDEIWVYAKGGDRGSVIYPGSTGMGGSGIGMGSTGTGIGISTGRGGTVVGTSGGIGIGGGMGGVGIGGTGMGGMGGPIVTRPTPPDIREVVFRKGVVVRSDKP